MLNIAAAYIGANKKLAKNFKGTLVEGDTRRDRVKVSHISRELEVHIAGKSCLHAYKRPEKAQIS